MLFTCGVLESVQEEVLALGDFSRVQRKDAIELEGEKDCAFPMQWERKFSKLGLLPPFAIFLALGQSQNFRERDLVSLAFAL